MSEYKLSVSMVPQALWGENLRKHLTRGNWNKLRTSVFEREPNCEFCGSTPIGAARQAHEEWVYDIDAAVARLGKGFAQTVAYAIVSLHAAKACACDACATFRALARRRAAPREVAAGENVPDIAQVDVRVCAFVRTFRQIRQVVRDPRQQRAQLGSRQAHQFGYRQHSHCFLHHFPAAPIAAFWRRPQRRRRRVHRLRPERRGGVRSTCAHQAEERCFLAERRAGLVRSRWRKQVPGANRCAAIVVF
jgi:hypothetical protein